MEKVFTSGSSRSFASEHFVPKMLKREFTGDYQMDAAMKDLENVKKAILTFPGSKPMLEGMVSVYNEAIKNGFGNKSKSAMLKVYEERFNISLKNK